MRTPARARVPGAHTVEFASIAQWFADVVAEADMRASVPTCPGWTIYDLVAHVGNTHSWAATVLETCRMAPQQNDEPGSRRPRAVASWYAAKAEDLYQVLRETDPERDCWNFAFGSGTAGFWSRRQLHETTVHACDLGLAAGRWPDLRPEVAADGVDEVLRVFLHRMHTRGHPAQLSRAVSIVATDVGRDWTIRPARRDEVPSQDGSPVIVDGATAPDRVEGPAALLYTTLWKRPAPPGSEEGLSYAGDRSRIEAFLASRLVP